MSSASTSKFRLKRKRRKEEGESSTRRHRSKRRDTSRPVDEPSSYDDTYLPNSRSSNYIDPDAAFRESLFDALADDEGAAYWEGVYGQPIHTYPFERTGPDGELERMTDEEYAAFVRARMYEKTHQHAIEERARREDARQREKLLREEGRKAEKEGRMFERIIDERLRSGQDRMRKKELASAWEDYNRKWERLNSGKFKSEGTSESMPGISVKDQIPWPVQGGMFSDVRRKAIEDFFKTSPFATGKTDPTTTLQIILKAERVRWHPDKMQQKLGIQGIDDPTMKAVTAVFQVIDCMWTDSKAG
ncbi:MAG: hypothetical protein M1824_002116 [Vezdaea acicularis]|nr:MAG: hypothetical protein M1824_002116 [Vezdaea acicularis]